MKFGLEQEFFVAKTEGWCRDNTEAEVGSFLVGGLHASLTPDDCGFLAEARGKPFDNIREAVFSLQADVFRLEQAAKALNLELIMLPNLDVPYAELLKSRRQFQKGVLKFQNLYGHESHKEKKKKTAGIHISFTDFKEFHYTLKDKCDCETSKTFTYQPVWDFVQVFRSLDIAFKQEIKNSRRNPGFYEIKDDGRVEYRSLPNTVDLKKVITETETAFK